MDDILRDFLTEACEHLEAMEQGLLNLENNRSSSQLNEIFRSIHTIKGGSGFLDLKNIGKISHHMESLLDQMRKGRTSTPSLIETLLKGCDLLKMIIDDISEGRTSNEQMIEKVNADLEKLTKSGGLEESEKLRICQAPTEKSLNRTTDQIIRGLERWNIDIKGTLELIQELKPNTTKGNIALHTISDSLRALQEGQLERSPVLTELITDSIKTLKHELLNSDQGSEIKTKTKTETVFLSKTMRVKQSLLDCFMNLVGELIVARNGLEHLEKQMNNPALKHVTQNVARIAEEMQRVVMSMRLVPINQLFQKFPRIIRDLSRQMSKKIQLVIEGETTEIDKVIMEKLVDPMTHLIRNSIDHGLEPPEQRNDLGKPETGTISLKAHNNGNTVCIEIHDDGQGLDNDKIKRKAMEHNLYTREILDSMDDEEILNIIFNPGFSTAENITDISGRGVGMDVVRTNIEAIGGQIQICSKRNEGTAIKLTVPSTISLINALLVEAANRLFAIPLLSIQETVRFDKIRTIGAQPIIIVRDEIIPLVDMAKALNYGNCTNHETALIVSQSGKKIGIVVDKILSREEILIKPLKAQCNKALLGASIRGNGEVVLIIEPTRLKSN